MELRSSSTPTLPQRLLIPIDSREESRWPIRYALNRGAAGAAQEIFLVYLLPPVGPRDLLRFRAEQQDAEQLLHQANILLEEAAARLLVAGIPCHKYVRETNPIQGVRDLAEEWACSGVVLPSAYRVDLFNGSQHRQLERALRVIWVRGDGSPEPQLNDGEN